MATTQTQVNGNGSAVAKKEPSVVDTIIQKLSGEAMKRQFATACPTHLKVNAERYARQFCTQIRLNPKLAACEPASLVGAMLTGTALGLDPSPSLGEFYIIPYENKRGAPEAQFQLGYKGMVALAYRGGVKRFEAHEICEKDYFDYSLGMNPKLEHKPYINGGRGNAIAYYAIAQLPSGETVFEIMSRAEVEDHARKYSRAYNNGPWKTEFDEMAKKTVAKSLFKWIPKSTELSVAVSKDGSIAHVEGDIRSSEDVLDADVRYVEPEDAASSEALADEIRASSAPAPTPAGAAPIDPDMIDLGPADDGPNGGAYRAHDDLAAAKGIGPDPEPTPDQKPAAGPGPQAGQAPRSAAGTELEKLRENLTGLLSIHYNAAEAEGWVERNFGKAMKALTKDDLKAEISKINAELDARELGI